MGTISSEDLDYLFKTNSTTTLIFSSKFSKHGLFGGFLSKNLRNVARLSLKIIWEEIIVTGLHDVNSWEQLS